MGHALFTSHSGQQRFGSRSGVGGPELMSAPISDAVLAQKAGTGDHIAFSELTHRYYARCVRVALGLLKNSSDAEDIAQEAFVRAYRRLRYFEGKSSFYTWIYRIVVNLCIDRLRQKKRRSLVNLEHHDTQDTLSASQGLWPRFDAGQPETHALNHELRDQLQAALSELSSIHQAVFILREVEGLSYEAIASTLKIKKGTVMSRLFHARQALQKSLRAQHQKEEALVCGRGRRDD